MKKQKYMVVSVFIISLLLLFIGCDTYPADENQVLEGEYIFATYGFDDSAPFASIHTMSFQATYGIGAEIDLELNGDGTGSY